MSPVKFEKKSAAVDALEDDDDDDDDDDAEEEALLPPSENTNNDNKSNPNKTKLLSKMRPKALDLSPNGLRKAQVGTASTDELVGLEIREKSWRECKNRASGARYYYYYYACIFIFFSLQSLFAFVCADLVLYSHIFHSFVCARAILNSSVRKFPLRRGRRDGDQGETSEAVEGRVERETDFVLLRSKKQRFFA